MAVSNILLSSLINPPQADLSGALAQGESNALANRLATAKAEAAEFGTSPEALERATRADELKLAGAEAKARKDATDSFNAATDREREDAIEAASMFDAIQSGDVGSQERFARTHPIDAFESGVTIRTPEGEVILNPDFFGSEQEAAARLSSDVVLNAARTRAGLERAPEKADRTLVEIADPTSPTGTRLVPRAEASGQPGKPASGTSLTVGPEGEVTLTQGRGVSSGLQKPTITKLETSLINSAEALARLEAVGSTFDSKFLEFGTKVKVAFNEFREKAGGILGEVSAEDQQQIADYETFALNTISNLNLYIKEITGAQMSEPEAERLSKGVPTLDDSPSAFKAKMAAVVRNLKLARARAAFTLRNGGEAFSIPLGSVEGLMVAREEELRSQGLEDEQIGILMKEEFGL